MSFGARAAIHLDALKHNLERLRQAAPAAKLMAVVKANAYGHGLVPVARELDGADAIAVARLPEAIELRDAGIEQPVTILSGVFSTGEFDAAAARGFELVVHAEEQLGWFDRQVPQPLTVWLKIDSGMNRLGFSVERAPGLIERLRRSAAVAEVRLMTHFAEAEEREGEITRAQLARFRDIAKDFEGAVGLANSPALLGWPDIAAGREGLGFGGEHWVRTGIALYGISPYPDRTGADLGLKPVMRFEARIIAVKPLAGGARVGYKGRYVSATDTKMGVIAAGYGDGYTRHFKDGTPVLVNGRRVPLIGHVSMDLSTVDLGPDATDSVGDIATLWGGDLPIEEIAPWADAIPYDLVCGVMNREASKLM